MEALQSFCEHLTQSLIIHQPVEPDVHDSGYFILDCFKQAVSRWVIAEQTSSRMGLETEREQREHCCLNPQALVDAQEKLGEMVVSMSDSFSLVSFEIWSLSEQLESLLQNNL